MNDSSENVEQTLVCSTSLRMRGTKHSKRPIKSSTSPFATLFTLSIIRDLLFHREINEIKEESPNMALLILLGISTFCFLSFYKNFPFFRRSLVRLTAGIAFAGINAVSAFAQPHQAGGEANLKLPDLSQVTFLGGTNGHSLL